MLRKIRDNEANAEAQSERCGTPIMMLKRWKPIQERLSKVAVSLSVDKVALQEQKKGWMGAKERVVSTDQVGNGACAYGCACIIHGQD
jgi:hypothetical protein